MNFTTKKINIGQALFGSAVLFSMLGGIILTDSNSAQAQAGEVRQRSIIEENKPDVTYLSRTDRKKAERSLDRNNCALFRYGIKCAYGNAGTRNHILKSVRRGHAYGFRGDGRVLSYYINKVGIDAAILELQRFDIDF